jgi:hypothetical protein
MAYIRIFESIKELSLIYLFSGHRFERRDLTGDETTPVYPVFRFPVLLFNKLVKILDFDSSLFGQIG